MMKKIISWLLVAAMLLGIVSILAACGDDPASTTTGEEPGPGPADTTTPETPAPENSFALVTDGKANFQLVYDQYASDLVKLKVNSFKSQLNALGAEVEAVEDYRVPSMKDCEVLIGAGVRYRDDFADVDVHTVGEDGYIIKVAGQRVMIAGGSDEALCEAVDFFAEEYLHISEVAETLGTVYLSNTLLAEKKTEYAIDSISINGQDLTGYTIVAETTNKNAYAAAQSLQAAFYTNAGIWLPIANTATGNAVRFVSVEPEELSQEGFRMDVKGNDLVISCAYGNAFTKGVDAFAVLNLSMAEGDVSFASDFVYLHTVSMVRYSEFGAVGDGVTDDFEAICETHAYANEGGQKVYADAGATYYIGDHAKTATIKTDTDWGKSKFIIDDANLDEANLAYNIFSIAPDYASFTIDGITSLDKEQTKLDVELDGPCLLLIENSNEKIYIRYGGNQNNGTTRQEVVLVDEKGNIDPDTPLLWDYTAVTKITAYRADERPLTVCGGEFTTIANNSTSTKYFGRGIEIRRSNTVVRDVIHKITGEGDVGSPYTGFYSIRNANNILLENCVMTGHKTYKKIGNAGTTVSMGTYDTSANRANNVVWRGCTQTNSITNSTYWGVMASNFCKNLTYDSCELSRFDAHMGMYNATVINSVLGHSFNAIGSGTLLVENTTKVAGSSFLSLRQDYGSTWDGDVIIRDCTFETSTAVPSLISASWVEHNFGYPCYLPRTLTVEGLTLGGSITMLNIYSSFTSNPAVASNDLNPYHITEKISLTGITGADYRLFPNEVLGNQLFAQTEIIDNKKEEE